MSAANPVLVEVTRGDVVESRHRGAAVVVDAAGKPVRSWGDVDQPIYPRSANKPLQAMALLETGAAERWTLSDAEVALACASHYGEPRHTESKKQKHDRPARRVGRGPVGEEPRAHAGAEPRRREHRQ